MDTRRTTKEVAGISGPLKGSSGLRWTLSGRGLLLTSVWLAAITAHAQDATWSNAPVSADWNTAANWLPPTIPAGTASFGTSTQTALTFSLDTTIGALQFNTGAPAYSFNLAVHSLTITGAGIVDNSSNRPTFSVTGQPTTFGLRFLGASTAGDAFITNSAQGHTDFYGTSTAGNATIISDTGAGTFFHETSTGGQARFIAPNAGGGFDISDLASAGMTAGSIEGAGGYNLGSKSLTVGSNNLSTAVSGIIADGGLFDPTGTGGSLIKVGTGTLTLSGLNTYSGGTQIISGTLIAEGNSAVGVGAVQMVGGTLDILAGVMLSNPIGFQQGGTVINAGAVNNNITNSPSVGTTQAVINFGTINGNVQLGGGIDIVQLFTGSKITGNVNLSGVQGSTLILDGTGQQLLSSAVTGTLTNNGTLVKQGTGTWTIDEDLTAPLATNILAGTLVLGKTLTTVQANISPGATLQFGTGGTAGSLAGTVVDNGSLVFNRSDTSTFAGSITGSGNLIQAGSGTTVLSGANTYSGGTIVNLGTLTVNNAKALGTGNVTVNGGVLSADLQPINVVGNYAQNAGGTLQLNIAGRVAGQFDALNVGGNAFLNGTLRLINKGFQPTNGDKLQLVTTGGLVSGRFSTFDNPFALAPGFNTIELVYARQSVTLEFLNSIPPAPPIVITDFASFALTANQRAIATQLNNVQMEQKDPKLIDFLQNEPFANLPGDFDKISPESLSALYEISFSAANIQASNLEERFAEIRNGSTGFSSSLNVTNTPPAIVEGKDGKAIMEPGKGVMTPSAENRWGVWISGSGDYVNVSSDGNAHGYDFTTGGVTLGLDYRLTPNLAVGVALGYAHTWTNLTGNGDVDANSGRAGLYATYYQSGFYLSGYAGAGYNSYDTRRAALDGTASGSTDGGEFDGYIGGGYEFHYGGFTFGPIASLQYTYVDISGNTESGSLAPLQINSKSTDSLHTNLGVSASYTAKIGKIEVTPSLRATWQHEYLYSALPITAQFASGAGNAFTVVGPAEGHDSALINAGINVQWTPRIGTYFGYNGQVGRSRYDSQGGVCSVHFDF